MVNLSTKQQEQFAQQGFLRVSGLADPQQIRKLSDQVARELSQQPMELEVEVGYPGAPAGPAAQGARTPRRLLGAYARGGALERWAAQPVPTLSKLMASSTVWLSQAHHNCVMTKYPDYSSDTLWHQDIRFWSFEPPQLINCWLALGQERAENGGLLVIPGSHHWRQMKERLTNEHFLDPRHPENTGPIAEALQVDLEPGDALLFHAGLFHAASRNHTDQVKLSVVYSYHGADVRPVAGSRSASLEEIQFDV